MSPFCDQEFHSPSVPSSKSHAVVSLYLAFTNEAAGLEKLYPVLYADVIDAITTISVGTHSPNQLYYVFPAYPFTQIAVARMLQKHSPLIKIDFKKRKLKEKTYYVPGGGPIAGVDFGAYFPPKLVK